MAWSSRACPSASPQKQKSGAASPFCSPASTSLQPPLLRCPLYSPARPARCPVLPSCLRPSWWGAGAPSCPPKRPLPRRLGDQAGRAMAWSSRAYPSASPNTQIKRSGWVRSVVAAEVLGYALPVACVGAVVAERPADRGDSGDMADLVRRDAFASGGECCACSRKVAGEPPGFVGWYASVLQASAEVAHAVFE